MSASKAKKQFDENFRMFSAHKDQEKYNLYAEFL